MIERFNRTIRDKINKFQITFKTKKYIDNLELLVNSYNNSIHSSINLTP